MFVLGVISIEVWPTQMPVWCFVVALIIGQSSVHLRNEMSSEFCVSLRICHSYRNDSGHHESASRIKVCFSYFRLLTKKLNCVT
jgi:hypothetical protein